MDVNIKNNVKNRYLVFLSFLVLFGILANSYTTFYWSDDHWFSWKLRSCSAIQFIWDMYNTWDGRHLTVSGFTQAFLIKNTNSFITILFWASCYITTFYFISKSYFSKNHFINTALLGSSFLVIFQSHLFQTLYWSVGGLYSMVLLIGAIWIYLYKNYKLNIIIFYLISLIAGATSQNLSISFIAIIGFDICWSYFKTRKLNRRDFISLGFIIAGILFISLAPGNRSRGFSTDGTWTITSKVIMMIDIYFRALILTKPIFFIAPVFSFITYKIRHISEDFLLTSIRYLLAGIVSLLPFVFLPPQLAGEARTNIFFQFFFFLSVVNFTWYIIDRLNISQFYVKLHLQLTNILSYGILLSASILLALNFQTGLKLKAKFQEREILIKNSNLKNILVEPIAFKGNRSTYMHYFFDVTTDSTRAFNVIASKYYDIETIRSTSNQAFQ